MAVTRLELDAEHARRLTELSHARQSTESAVIVELIDQAYAEVGREQRLRLVAEIGGMSIEDLPDPDTMSSQLAEAHGRPDLY